MIAYLLDTNHASAILRDDQVLRERVSNANDCEFSLSMPTVGELWYMVHKSQHVHRNAAELVSFLRGFQIWPFDNKAAREFGRIRVELQRRGRPIPAIDVQIAAVARVNDLIILSADRHFRELKGIAVENWLAIE